jgi:hypothetical protein
MAAVQAGGAEADEKYTQVGRRAHCGYERS